MPPSAAAAIFGVRQVDAAHLGVHHPKFGLLFLKDGSLVVYVSTGNMGVDTAIDATWCVSGRKRGGEGEGNIAVIVVVFDVVAVSDLLMCLW